MSRAEKLENKLVELHQYRADHPDMDSMEYRRWKKLILDTEKAIDQEHLRNSPGGSDI